MKISIINGPNINLIGVREPEIYGSQTFEHYFEKMRHRYETIDFDYFQSNIEGELINEIQRAGMKMDGIILNAGGYTHTSVAIGDAVAASKAPVIEVHVSNINAREEFRMINHISAKCKGTIIGLGLKGYAMAVEYFFQK
ncbi:MAG: type II 3-dehydroquinate dehydratase [Chitinophagaceae bacterium]|nr:type II 3-dehydroquinate dehydratase [Chitinophagaceae bacterium]